MRGGAGSRLLFAVSLRARSFASCVFSGAQLGVPQMRLPPVGLGLRKPKTPPDAWAENTRGGVGGGLVTGGWGERARSSSFRAPLFSSSLSGV